MHVSTSAASSAPSRSVEGEAHEGAGPLRLMRAHAREGHQLCVRCISPGVETPTWHWMGQAGGEGRGQRTHPR